MNKRKCVALGMALVLTASSAVLTGCGSDKTKDGRTIVTMLQYKPEAVSAFDEMAERFNASQDEIYLEIESPNDAMTVLKTRFVREDYPDIIGIGGDINYSNFLDANMFMDISDFDGISDIKPAYMDIVKELEFIPQDGVHALPYVANCAGILYNKDMFEENGWEIPTTWSEFTALCDTISSQRRMPIRFTMGFKDTWTCYGTVERVLQSV
ncbi:MAG: ABC transporter substrate-binding protein [Ruminococcus sp.]